MPERFARYQTALTMHASSGITYDLVRHASACKMHGLREMTPKGDDALSLNQAAVLLTHGLKQACQALACCCRDCCRFC